MYRTRGVYDNEKEREGLKWMIKRDQYMGGILENDNFISTATQLCQLMYINKKTTLIVCLNTSIKFWDSFIRENTRLKVMTYHYSHSKSIYTLEKSDVVITTYATLNTDENLDIFQRYKWYRVICADAHAIKNNKSKRYKTIMETIDHNVVWMIVDTHFSDNSKDVKTLLRFFGYNPDKDRQYEYMRHYILRQDDIIIRKPILHRHRRPDVPSISSATLPSIGNTTTSNCSHCGCIIILIILLILSLIGLIVSTSKPKH